jgi:hypothetical protein
MGDRPVEENLPAAQPGDQQPIEVRYSLRGLGVGRKNHCDAQGEANESPSRTHRSEPPPSFSQLPRFHGVDVRTALCTSRASPDFDFVDARSYGRRG